MPALGCLRAGRWSSSTTAAASGPQPLPPSPVGTAVAATGGRVRDAWDAAAEWDRSNDFLADLAGAVGLNVDQVDQMFREAAAIRS
jgi:hypothetical protein